jgi:hypothetical protein
MVLVKVRKMEGREASAMRISWRAQLFVCAALAMASTTARAASLNVVEVGAPAVNCIYDTSCKITVNDSVGDIVLSGTAAKGVLQSRAFVGSPGAPAANKQAFMYRVDMMGVTATGAACVSALKIDFGPVLKFRYGGAEGSPADVFVITSGGIGTIGLASADQAGSVITFTFARPVCAGLATGKGESSYFFGLTANGPPKATSAQLQVTGAGTVINLPARVPAR